MRSHDIALDDLFGQKRRCVVPLFQRPYVWKEEEHWKPLWQDITNLAEAILEQNQAGSRSDGTGNHFLGAVVLNQVKTYGKQVSTVQVIDGQQRLTTLQLMIAAFRDLVATTEERQLCADLQRLTENAGVMESDYERFKVWPTNADRQDFESSMSAGSLDALLDKYPPQRRKYARKPDPRPPLVEAYKFFSNAVQEFCLIPDESLPIAESQNQDEDDAKPVLQLSVDRVDALSQALQQHIQFVVIDLEDKDDPQVIFETLNDRGARLLPSDLIRNFVFLRAAQQGIDADKLYKSHWSEYDKRPVEVDAGKDGLFWKQEERQGRVLRTRLDLFVHHYVQYRSVKDFSIGHLYKNFCTWWEEEEAREVSHELADMREYSDAFARFFVPEGDSRVDIFAKRLRDIDTSTVYPVLLMLLVGGRDRIEPAELDGIITDLESYLVRRMVCNLGTKNYNRFFLSLLEYLRDAEKITRSSVRKFLLEAKGGPSVEWPDDKKFSREWLEAPVYTTMKATKCSMVLSAIDRAMLGDKQEEVTIGGKLTIEHVLPQEWKSADWLEPVGFETRPESEETAKERRNRLKHSFGNLTLLTQKLNSSVSNGPYDKKRLKIAKQSTLRLNTHFQDTMKWNEEEIEKRGRILLEEAKNIWPYPNKEG